MVRLCKAADELSLMEYLRQDAAFHTFLLADIGNYGFDQEFQTVYADYDDRTNAVCGVYLKFYGNLIVAGERMDEGFLENWFAVWKPDAVMGKAELVKEIEALLPDYDHGDKYLYTLPIDGLKPNQDEDTPGPARRGIPGDEDKIHGFLMTIVEIRALYMSKEMIADRLRTGDGSHLYLEQDGKLIAHVNSAAKSPYTVMIGGVAVKESERGHKLASGLVRQICEEITGEGKMPCLFCDRGTEQNLFVRLGFLKAGMWGTLTKPEENGSKLPSYIPIYNQLYQDLMDGVYEKDSLLPSENVLAAAYKVSRNTLRQALTILCQDGYIYKKQGKGTFVSYDRNRKEKKRLYNFLRECAMEPVKEVKMDYNMGAPTNIARTKLSLEYGEWVLASNNVYIGEDGPIGQSFLQIPGNVLIQSGNWPLKEQSSNQDGADRQREEALLEFMEQGLYDRAVNADVSVKIMTADEQVIPYMKLAEGTALLYMEQVLYGQDHNALARIKYFFNPDKYQIDFSIWA